MRIVGCLEKISAGNWQLTKATPPTRVVRSSTPTGDKERALGTKEFRLKFVLTSLDRYVGHRMLATGSLLGEGGADGINVDTTTSLATTCQ